MAKDEAEPLMSPAELKPLLMLSKRQPVNCAFGLTRDKVAAILLDKKAKPRKMLALLKKKAASKNLELDMATCRFGQALVDGDEMAGVVQFVVNKEAPGAMRPKLLEQLKKAGFGRCEIRVDDALNAVDEDEDDATDTAGMAQPASTADDAAPPDAGMPADPAATEMPAGAADAAASAASDAGDVTKRLTDLVRRMVAGQGSNPAAADAMRTAAMAGQAALRAGDPATASASADTLERLLNAMPATGAVPPDATQASATQASATQASATQGNATNAMGSPVFGKARATWIATRKKVEAELEKLHDRLQATYKGHGVVADLETVFRAKVEPMMAQFDETLSEKLDAVSKATDPATHAGLVAEAKQIIARYEGYLANEPLIDKLDSNPFVPLAIEKTLLASLTALSKAVA